MCFIGYVVLGHYIKTYAGDPSWKKILAYAIPFWVVGYMVSAGGFWRMIPSENGFPVSGSYAEAFSMEAQRGFCTVGIMLQTVAYFLVIRKIKCDGWFYKMFVFPLSKLSYGMYLMHMFVLTPVFAMVSRWSSSTPVVMVASALITFIFCALLCRLISFLPKSKYLVG